MFLSDWYFCKTIHLSIKETTRFIDTMLDLRDPNLPIEEKNDALNSLLGMEALNNVYALPALVDGLLAPRYRENFHTEAELPGQAQYMAMVKECIRSTVREISKYDYLQAAVDDLDCVCYEQLAQYLMELEFPLAESGPSSGYLGMEVCAVEILAMSLLRTAAKQVPEEVQRIVDPSAQKPWFTAALHGTLGELPWALAIETLALCGIPAISLLDYFPKDFWLGRPDKLELAARIFFPDGSGSVDKLLYETFDMKRLTDLYARTVNNAAAHTGLWLDSGADKEQQKRYIAVLWQVTLWALAAERDPSACIQMLPSYWGIPSGVKNAGQSGLLSRVFQQILAKNRDASRPADARLAVCSPWLLRKRERGSAHEKYPLAEYPELQQRHLALRAFAIPVIMRLLLRALPEERKIPAYFLRLLLCYGDAFEFRTIRWIYYQLQNESNRLPKWYTPAIYSLLLCACGAVSRLGTGQIDSRMAGELVSLLEKESPVLNREYTRSRPHQNLFCESAFITAAHWAHESLSNVTFTHGIEENPWLCGEYASNGAHVCRWFFNEVWDYVERREPGAIQRNAREATQLSFQIFPDILEQSGRKESWLVNIPDQGEVSTQDLLLSEEMSYEDWERCPSMTAQRFKADAYEIGLSMRLRALLTHRDPARIYSAEDVWVSQWNEQFYSIQSKAELSRVCRYLISEFFTLPVSTQGQANILLDVCGLVIDTIVEFSDDAPFYLQHLAEELSRPLPIGDISAVVLRQNFLAALVLYMQREKDLLPVKQKKTKLLPYYMMMIADQFQADPLYAKQMRTQRNTERLAAFRCKQEPADMVSPNEFLNHALYHRDGDTLQSLSANIQMPFFANLHNGFSSGTAAPKEGWQLGVVLSCSKNLYKRTARLDLNLGSGQTETFYPPIDRNYYDVGDLVAVKRSDNPEVASVRYVSAWTGLVEAREFEISSSQIKIKIDGRWHYSVSRDRSSGSRANLWALRVWSPDVRALHEMQGTFHGAACLVSLEQLDDGSSFWKPEERDFHALLAEQFLSPKHPEREITLVYIERSAHEYLFSSAPGENYRLTDDVWETESFRVFHERLSAHEADEACGLRVRVRLTTDKRGAPHIALAEQDAFDDTNLRFQHLFQDGQPLIIRREGPGWVVPSEANDGVAAVNVQLIRMPASFQGKCDSASAEVQVADNGWDLVAQRENRLRVTALEVQELTPPLQLSSQLEYFLNLQAGSRVRLEQIKDRTFLGYYTGKLTSGVQVQVAAESVSWESSQRTPRLFSGREAIVENIHFIPGKADQKAVPCQLPAEELGGYDSMKGIISRIADVPGSSLAEAENLCVDVNVLLNGKAVLLREIPRSAFSPAPKSIGEIFEAKKGADGWTFQIRPRNIFVRALWRVFDHAEERDQHATGLFLRMTSVHGYGMRVVTQDLQKPILHLWSPSVRSALENTVPAGITAGTGKAQRIGRRFCSTSIFKWGFNTEIVRLVTARGEYIGEAPSGTFPRTLTSWSNCQLQIHSVSYGQDGFQYDLRRIFVAELAEQCRKEEDDQERLTQWQSRYDEWCEAGDFHGIGVLKQNRDGHALFAMNDLRLPQDGSRDTPLEAWMNMVPLQDASPLVSGRNYDTKNVRAYLHLRNGAWEASIRDARPMSLAEFAQYFNVSPPGRSLSVTLVFAGYDEEERPCFEWGYGFTLTVEPSQLEIGQAPYGAHDLFFGDHIKGFTLELRREDAKWLLRIPREKIIYEVEGRVWRDAEAGVVQQLKVRRVPLLNTVSISKISVSTQEISKAADEGRHWDFCSINNAVLDAPSVSRALDILPDAEESVVLARLNIAEDKRHLKVLHFTLLGGELGGKLQKGDILCLVGGAIEPKYKDESTRIGNDYRINFSMPQEVDERISNPMQVSVQRRFFSYDESILRVQYRKDPMAYSGYYMMVRLREGPNEAIYPPVWQGSVIHAIRRPEKRLRDWAALKQAPMVTLGETEDDGQTPVEIAPGVICHIAAQPDFEQGMLAVLRIEDGTLKVESILLGDREYIPEQGRPVELLIMDGTWRKPAEGSVRPSKFTIAGLPQVLFSSSLLMEREMRKEPPRFAYLRPFGEEQKLFRVDDSVPVQAGYLHCETADAAPYVVPVSAPDESHVCSWRQLSFWDGTMEEVYDHAKRGRWYYHERFTGILYDEQRSPKKVLWPKGNRFHQIPLLFAQGWRLRYTPKELPQYVFSARDVIENGLPEGGGWYPVASSTADSLYIEVLPGKIVDIPNSMLVAGKKQYGLSHMCMKVFSPGDQVQLSMAQVPAGMRAKLQMTNFRFGPRGSFAEGSALLLVQAAGEGGLTLGSSIWRMTVPCEESQEWKPGDLAALCPTQALKKVTSSSEIMEGDTILVARSNGHFFIPGLPEWNLRILCDHRSNGGWVNQLLMDAPEKLFAVLPTLPVRVIKKRVMKQRTQVLFAYEQAEFDGFVPGCQLPCICLGELPGGEGAERLVLVRSGAHLLTVPGSRFLPGMPAQTRSEAIRFMVKKQIALWMHLDEEGWTTGLTKPDGRYRRIQLLAPLSGAQGILCLEQETLSLCWLPAEEASRADGADTEILYHILPRECAAAVLEDQTMSIIQTQESLLQYENLGSGSRQFRVIPKHSVNGEDEQERSVYRYLCQRYPKGDIFWLDSERELRQECREESPVPVEVVRKSRGNVEVVPTGMHRITLDLPSWIFAGLRDSVTFDEASFRPEQFEKTVPARFEEYRNAIQNAELLHAGYVSVPPGSCEIKLLTLFVTYLKRGQDKKRILPHVKVQLASWLRKNGTILAVGADVHTELDLLPTVAAVLLMSAASEQMKELSALTVHLARMLGNLAGGNIHQEILLEHWLLSKRPHPQSSLWGRLNRLQLYGQTISGEASGKFDGKLTQNQALALTSTCNSILNRSSIPGRGNDSSLTVTARALLFAAGSEADYEPLYRSSLVRRTCCSRIYQLGRSLTPGMGHNLAVDRLASSQVDILNKTFLRLRRQDALPITLNAQNMYPISAANRDWAREKCKEAIDLLTEASREK